ncbi:hypothetical protein [Planococcus soli]|uniref:hypothetical protein n=1 Tax=Planococcus soli TaxID=2666072 RepID=UPI00115CCEF4|nr:hypothetical protein [Planococcus soli]
MVKTKGKEEIFNIPANLFKGWEGVGGRLIITEEKVVFTPHKVNFQTEQVEVELSSIIEVGRRNTLKLVPNGFYIKDLKGIEYKFVVHGRNEIIGYLSNIIGKS